MKNVNSFDPSLYEYFSIYPEIKNKSFTTPYCNLDCTCRSNFEFKLPPSVLLILETTEQTKAQTIYLDYYAGVLGCSPEKVILDALYIEPINLDQSSCPNGLDNFWRSATNLIFHEQSKLSISQACPIRNCEFSDLQLCYGLNDFKCCSYNAEFTSGGFMFDILVKNEINFCSQQQFCIQDSQFSSPENVSGGAWSLVFYNCRNAPPNQSYSTMSPNITNVQSVPIPNNKYVKPPLLLYINGKYTLQLGDLDKTTSPDFLSYCAFPGTLEKPQILTAEFFDTANDFIILPAGIYQIKETIHVYSNLVGIGLPIIQFLNQSQLIFHKEFCSSIIFDNYSGIMNYGSIDSFLTIQSDNVSLFDIFMRNGGPIDVAHINDSMLIIQGKNTYLNNLWLWNADHNYSGNPPLGQSFDYHVPHGLVMEESATNTTAIGLAVEHMDQENVIWMEVNVFFFKTNFPTMLIWILIHIQPWIFKNHLPDMP